MDPRLPGVEALGIHERVDDYSAAAFFYCRTPQPVDRLDVAAARADLGRLPHERPTRWRRGSADEPAARAA